MSDMQSSSKISFAELLLCRFSCQHYMEQCWGGRKLSRSVSAIAFILIPWGFMGVNSSPDKKSREAI